MNLHEYQAKRLLEKFDLPIPPFIVISSLGEVEDFLRAHPWDSAVLKVQIHAGGRGKAGGVKLAHNRNEILAYAKELLGKKIVNEQTGAQGIVTNQILLTLPVEIQKEYYLSIAIDRNRGQAVLIASPEGGMDIELIAHTHPDKVITIAIPSDGHFHPYHLLRIAKFMGWNGELFTQGSKIINGLVKAFHETDASIIEINPLVLTKSNKLTILDAKLVVDDNALYRQQEIKDYFDPSQMSSQEAHANAFELAYVPLEGTIGCMVNGAGLAMATMDLIEHYGGKPANFLDVGGSATAEKISEGFKIILSDGNVRAILVNIFGGIMNCNTIAEGIIIATKEAHVAIPLVIRMEGTNVEEGKNLLNKSGLKNIIIANDLSEAAKKVVKASKVGENG